ncbi:acyltransferase family protein [Leptospira santarosai]|uniref:acyltransferase family protein n=1 Tax=Leptospira santarosai TaxID=28183 RepID=UPI000772D810|nr:acyltransferase family protein [Leptospira santarosai]MDI7189563.1 acyltransferase family protein [Leptospira santarosai]MDI7211303.1 acyltransferase family protein [Leptospira santarosai]MDI7221747.1 acyltransferase family protein [Leptospira santarosai]
MTRIESLDIVRGIACLLILFAHLWGIPVFFSNLFSFPLFQGGSIGVDIFFVLSGFLITRILYTEFQDTQKIDFFKFYIRL